MAKSKTGKRYPPEFHRQMVELVRAGRKKSDLAREFGCSIWAMTRWVQQADRDEGHGDGGLTTSERHELAQLRRENRQLRMEREILSKAAPWFAQERVPSARRNSDS
jgi:transposase